MEGMGLTGFVLLLAGLPLLFLALGLGLAKGATLVRRRLKVLAGLYLALGAACALRPELLLGKAAPPDRP